MLRVGCVVWALFGFMMGADCLASPSIPPPPSISVPVWSLASPFVGREGTATTSMNIVTFASPVSVAPPKLWIVSLYTNTMTRKAFLDSKIGVLQLLTPTQKELVPALGKRSGYEEGYSKEEMCRELGYPWTAASSEDDNDREFLDDETTCSSLQLLPNCATYVKLKLRQLMDAGDHEVALCEVLSTGCWDNEAARVVICEDQPSPVDSGGVLYTGFLRDEGIL